ncbi:uncharacterized protein [Ambystoma mexicanum]|uniref:uncharacterized protein n=1 Tax=Ambystoma mexicanum TaxID=8296 RepID=UPI0037E91785
MEAKNVKKNQDRLLTKIWARDSEADSEQQTGHGLGGQRPESIKEHQDTLVMYAALTKVLGEMVNKITEASQGQMDTLREDLEEGIKEIKRDINKIEERVDTNERALQELTEDVWKTENLLETLAAATQNLELQAEELEHRSRRVNIRIKALPESVQQQDLKQTLISIFMIF